MRTIPATVAGLLLLILIPTTPAARAQGPPGLPLGVPALPPWRYAAQQLPEWPSHPWVMVPRYATGAAIGSDLDYGYRTSPYALYSRHAYWSTGPFPALARPTARFEKDPHDMDRYGP
jgi:hypothetical protein